MTSEELDNYIRSSAIAGDLIGIGYPESRRERLIVNINELVGRAVAEEREACAKIADLEERAFQIASLSGHAEAAHIIGLAIRNR